MLRNLLLGCIIIVLATVSFVNAQSALTVSIEAQERALNGLAARAEARYVSRCSHLFGCASSCSVPACGDDFSSSDFHCNATFGDVRSLCGDSCPGLIRSMAQSAVRFPRVTSFNSADSQAFVCASKGLDADFIQNIQQKTVTAWQYIGDESGAARIYPAAPQPRTVSDGCSNYDARLRPWYIAASSGPKDIVIIIDKSGSMLSDNDPLNANAGSRMDVVKSAVGSLLDTFTQNDFAAIVTFSGNNSVSVLNSQTKLQRMTDTTITRLKSDVRNIVPGGGTNFDPAFEKAFDIFDASTQSDDSSQCTRLILFLTDGQAQDLSHVTRANILARQSRLGSNKAHIFTYSMSSGADDTVPKAIACENQGVWAAITDGADPLRAMSQYYQFLASSITSNQVRWTTPYTDAFGMGEMVTAAKPVFDRSNANFPTIVGVVGLDVTMAELRQHGDFSTVVNALITRSSTCPSLSVRECQLQHLRSSSNYVCPGNNTIAACTANSEIVNLPACSAVAGGLNSLLCQNLQQSTGIPAASTKTTAQVACCPSCVSDGSVPAGAIAGTIIAVVVVVVVVAVIIIVVIKLKSSGTQPAATADGKPATTEPTPKPSRRNSGSHMQPAPQQPQPQPNNANDNMAFGDPSQAAYGGGVGGYPGYTPQYDTHQQGGGYPQQQQQQGGGYPQNGGGGGGYPGYPPSGQQPTGPQPAPVARV